MTFTDKDGKEFKFTKYDMIGVGEAKYPAKSGVYIIAKGHTPLFIGQSEDLRKWLVPGHKKEECAKAAGADAVYIFEAPKAELEKMVQDLVYHYNPECNGKD